MFRLANQLSVYKEGRLRENLALLRCLFNAVFIGNSDEARRRSSDSRTNFLEQCFSELVSSVVPVNLFINGFHFIMLQKNDVIYKC